MSTEISTSPIVFPSPKTDEKGTLGTRNEAAIKMLYKALSEGETEAVSTLIAGDLEYWFHGPPRCHHMMRVLTGETSPGSHAAGFCFEPRSVSAVGDACVIAEGWEGAKAYWVHVWMVKDGVITQFREYFNTWLTVRDLRPLPEAAGHRQSLSPTLWQSMPRDLFRRSLPGLLLAI